MNLGEKGFVLGSAAVAGGVPEDIQRGAIQLATAVIAWLSVETLNWLKKRILKK